MTLVQPLASPRIVRAEEMSVQSAEALIENRRNGAEGHIAAIASKDSIIKNEQPWHSHAVKYIAMGCTATETARHCDCTPAAIYRLMRTPWFIEDVNNLMAEGTADIMALFRGGAVEAASTLITICQNEKLAPAVRVTAAKEILERHLGKSTQFVEMKAQTTNLNPVEEAERLEKENLQMREQLRLQG